MPWKRCPEFCHGANQKCGCAFIRDRLAAQTILHAMPRTDHGAIPLWSEKMGGVVFKGSSNRIYCAYPGEYAQRAPTNAEGSHPRGPAPPQLSVCRLSRLPVQWRYAGARVRSARQVGQLHTRLHRPVPSVVRPRLQGRRLVRR